MVTRGLIALAKALKALGVENFEKLEDRISFQKKIYCLKICGFNLGYMFSWDLYGPYSKSLARDAGIYDEYRSEVDEQLDKFKFKSEIEASLSQAKRLIEPPEPAAHLAESVWLELLTSAHFLATREGSDLPRTPEGRKKIKQILFETKPHLREHISLLPVLWEHVASRLSPPA